jgi:recombination protein RecA
MPAAARAALETLLREHKLDRTLTSALPERWDDQEALAPTGLALLDAHLQGGLPRGQLSEIVGPASSGRTSLALALAAAATRRGELVAFIDTLDRGDAASMACAGIDTARVLWVRGHDVPLSRRALAPAWEPSRPRPGRARGSLAARALDRAIKAANLVLQAGGFGLVVLDLADVPLDALRGLPFTTWMRLQRVIEGSDTACVLVGAEAMARSAGGVSLRLERRGAPPQTATPRPPATANAPRERGDGRAADDGGRPPADPGEAQRFREAVLASRRPFVGQPQSPASVPPGRWTGEAPWARRFRGLTSEAVAVRAHRRSQTTRQVRLEFGA